MNCAGRRCWKAAGRRRRSCRCAGRCNCPTKQPSSRCYLDRRSWRPITRTTPARRSASCVTRSRVNPKRRSGICSWPWLTAKREIWQRPTSHRRRPRSCAATTRPRATSPRAPRPDLPSARRDGSRPTTSFPPSSPQDKRRTALDSSSVSAPRIKLAVEALKTALRQTSRNPIQKESPMPPLRLLVPAVVALALCASPNAAPAQSFSEGQRGEIESIIRSYLIAHPEVLEDAMAELNKRQAAAEAEKHEASIAQNSEAIFNSPRGVVLGNKDGDVTFVEFFDYNCGYCKRAMADMLDLMKTDQKLKVVLKEFPVLSQGSVEAAQVAVAVRMQDPSGKKYLDFHQKLLGGRGAADKARALAVAKDVGLDVAKLEKDMASPEVKATLEENLKLAEDMGMNGTPSYVIGKQIVVGAVGLDGLKEKIGIARCVKATC